MTPLRKALDKTEPLFHKGGKLERLYPVYEALDTFLYTPGQVTRGPSHVRDGMDLKRMMSLVIVSLLPAIYMAMWNTGYQANLALVEQAQAGVFVTDPSGEKGMLPEELRAKLGTDEGISVEDAQPLAHQVGWRGRILDATTGIDPDSFLSNLLHGTLWFLPVYLVTMVAGGTCEAIFSIVRGHEINEGFLVTGMLFPLTLPPTIPLWETALGIMFGVVLGKEVFGGTGRNFLNPALTARAFLYFAYPGEISGDKVWNAANAVPTVADGYTSATTLNTMNAPGATLDAIHVTWWDAFLGTIEGSMGETSVLGAIIGAAILIAVGVGSWRIMAACVIGLVGTSGILYAAALAGYSANAMWLMPPWWHLVVGGFAFGAVWMATDPVSASMTRTGMWWYGILIGFMTILIRAVNPAFPEGIMLAILFGNVFAPLIDYFVVQANIKRRLARNVA
ncbi:MAG: NADH:ubiquinone reductase (Na(+)-transporting) subunit B [Planctomycetaceae bacterium]|nr:NADH:ubiquinone reductase (Na(+)-transporting) subunit B [Planctomycetaceae bacterium]